MTTKLYYEDSEIAEAIVQVLSSASDEKGEYSILDQTCFYPEGGGQPADTGAIGKAKVLDVQTVEGEIRHYTNGILETGSYTATVDWKRRRDHMQQHAGQHVLSAVFDDFYGMKTQSFHLGEERVSIDLDCQGITDEQLRDVEEKANEVIRRHIPIISEWVTDEQAAELPLRKKPAVSGSIRLVKMGEIDLNACGGTHPKNTAAIGQIKLISAEKAKGGTRVYFLCGNRSMSYFQQLIETTDKLVHKLNAPISELAAAADALLNDKIENEKTIKEQRLQLLTMEANSLQAEDGKIEKVFYDRPFKEIQQLAKMATVQHPEASLLFLGVDGLDVRFVCARGSEVEGDMRQVLKELLALTEGKGGGNAQFAQGGGISAEQPDAFIHAFRKTLGKIQ